MNRNAVRIIACILCIIFTGFYYLVFNHQFADAKKTIESSQIESDALTNIEKREIYWLQLGIFNDREAVNQLIDRCAAIGIECHTYTKNESIIAFCKPTEDVASLSDIKDLLSENQIEYYQKSTWISDPRQLEQLEENAKEVYMEVISSLP